MRWYARVMFCLWTGTVFGGNDSLTVATLAETVSGTAHDSTSIDSSGIVRKKNALVAGMASALLPGAGQLYNRRFVKGGLILGAEALMLTYAKFWINAADQHDRSISILKDQRATLPLDSMNNELLRFFESPSPDMDTYTDLVGAYNAVVSLDAPLVLALDTARYNQIKQYDRAVHAVAWASGIYLYGIMDALDKTGHFRDTRPRNPVVAGWLSAVPALGLGQLYNRSLAKAGLIWMVQGCLGIISYNYNRQMRICEKNRERIGKQKNGYYRGYDDLSRYDLYWRDERGEAFQNRNTFLWYSVFFYFYGIFDAVVDAHLHDFDGQMKLEPDLALVNRQVGLKLTFDY